MFCMYQDISTIKSKRSQLRKIHNLNKRESNNQNQKGVSASEILPSPIPRHVLLHSSRNSVAVFLGLTSLLFFLRSMQAAKDTKAVQCSGLFICHGFVAGDNIKISMKSGSFPVLIFKIWNKYIFPFLIFPIPLCVEAPARISQLRQRSLTLARLMILLRRIK